MSAFFLSERASPFWRQLLPWSGNDADPPKSVQLWVHAARSAVGIQLGYRLIWAPSQCTLMVPLTAAANARDPQRMDGLWSHTCFEAFLGCAGSETYWEFNLSPASDWNVYRFCRYRHGQQRELFYGQLPLTVMGPRAAPARADCRLAEPMALLEIELMCALPPALDDCLPHVSHLQLGLTAVLEHADGELSYWGLQHSGCEPDFHDRRDWLMAL